MEKGVALHISGADPSKNRNDWRNVEGAWKKKAAQSKILKKGFTILSSLPALGVFREGLFQWMRGLWIGASVDDSTKVRTDKEHTFIK